MFPFDVLSWLMRGRYKISLSPVSDGGTPELLTDAYGRLRIVIDSVLGTSSSYQAYTHTGLVFKAQVKEAAGVVRQVVVTNTDAVEAWVAMFDLATMPGSAPSDLDAITTLLVVPPGETVSLPFEADVTYGDGIAFMAFTTADLDTPFGSKLKVHLLYS